MKPAAYFKKLLSISLFLIMLLAVITIYVPYHVETARNRLTLATAVPVTETAAILHQSLFIADMHADSLLWNRDLARASNYGHVDLPRMREGNLALQVFSIVSKTPHNMNLQHNMADSDNITALAIIQGWPPRTWTSLTQRALYQSQRLQALAESDANFSVLRSRTDLSKFLQRRSHDSRQLGGLLSLEGAHALEGDLHNLARLYEAGIRIIGLAHFFDTEFGGSAHGMNKSGLSVLGKRLITEMESRHMIIDLAHSSAAVFEDVVTIARRPLMVSHTGVYATCPGSRNLTDTQLQQIARSGGIIGIGFWPQATCGADTHAIVRAIRHAVNVAGLMHVGLGSDLDGAVSVPFTAADYSQLTAALLQDGFSEAEIHAIMGGNLLRFLQQNLPAS